MKIEPNAWVVVDYRLEDDAGEVLDASDGADGVPIEYVHGYGMLVPGLEKGLAGLSAGDTRTIVVPPEEGYGDRDEELVIEVERTEMPRPQSVAVGDELTLESPEGEEGTMRVVEVMADAVVLDGNHPLAGRTLRYSVRVRDVRGATEQEIAQAAAAFDEAASAPEPQNSDENLVQLRKRPQK